MKHNHKFANTALTTKLAETLLAQAKDQIPALTNEYARGRTITDGDGTVYAVYVVSLREILSKLGYSYPKKATNVTLGSW